MPGDGVIAVAIAIGAVGLAKAAKTYWGREGRAQRALAARPRSRIHGASGERLRVVGRVRRQTETLRAPISGRPCVAFQAFIDEHGGDEWRNRLSLRGARSFVIIDDSGEALVDTGGPYELSLVTDQRGSTGLLGTMGSAQLQAVRSYLGLGAPGARGAPRLRYREAVLQEGQQVAVGGSGSQVVSGQAPSAGRREPPRWLVLRGTANETLLISNWLRAIGGRWFARDARPQRASASTSVATKKATET
ncbi:MAG TPA: hypothetical protein VKZ18_00015 [Polyangia bacterium]|nr:hypothetical protein [Polyangia bacterium]